MKKCSVLILAVVMVVMLLVGCTQEVKTEEPAKAKEPEAQTAQTDAGTSEDSGKVYTIGVSLGSTIDVFDRILYEGMLKFEAENSDKVKTLVIEAHGDVVTQSANVEQLINSKVDVIILWPLATDALTPAVEWANEAGIPVVCVNTFTTGGEYVYVGSDDVDAGRIQGQWLVENMPENAKFGYLLGPQGHSGALGRSQGLEETLLVERTDITMLAQQTGEWDREKALKIVEDWLKAFPDMNVIVSHNDNMALGAIEAVRTAGKLDQIMIVGVDATEEACEKIKIGEMAMSVFQNATMQGIKSMEVALQIAMGTWTGGDSLVIPFEAVDKTNVDDFIALYK